MTVYEDEIEIYDLLSTLPGGDEVAKWVREVVTNLPDKAVNPQPRNQDYMNVARATITESVKLGIFFSCNRLHNGPLPSLKEVEDIVSRVVTPDQDYVENSWLAFINQELADSTFRHMNRESPHPHNKVELPPKNEFLVTLPGGEKTAREINRRVTFIPSDRIVVHPELHTFTENAHYANWVADKIQLGVVGYVDPGGHNRPMPSKELLSDIVGQLVLARTVPLSEVRDLDEQIKARLMARELTTQSPAANTPATRLDNPKAEKLLDTSKEPGK